MRRLLPALGLIVLATNLWALRGRPVSTLRFDDVSPVIPLAAASDGRQFLALTTSTGYDATFTQRIVDGRPEGPQRRIGRGFATKLVWTGTHYLAAWQDHDGLRVAVVSRDGSPLTAPEQPVIRGGVAFDFGMFAAGHGSAMAFGYDDDASRLIAQPLDLEGRPSGPAVEHAVPEVLSFDLTAGIAAEGFAVVFGARSETSLMLFRADGTAITDAPVVIDFHPAALYGGRGIVATNGEDTLVVAESWNLGELVSAIVDARGSVKNVRTIQSGYVFGRAQLAEAVWDGSRYVVSVSIARGEYDFDPALLVIGRGGEQEGGITWLADDPYNQFASALAWNGRQLVVTILDSAGYSMAVEPVEMRASPRVRLGLTAREQDWLAIEAGRDGYLAAWVEHAGGLSSIRATRIDRLGNHLDGDGLVLEPPWQRQGYPYSFSSPIAIEGTGPEWLVAWPVPTGSVARTISRDGVLSAPFPLGSGRPAILWNGSHYVVLRSGGSLVRDLVSPDGVFSTRVIAEYASVVEGGNKRTTSYHSPSIVRLGERFVAVFQRTVSVCEKARPTQCRETFAVLGQRIDVAGAKPFVIAEHVAGVPAVAAGATGALVVWPDYYGVSGAFIDSEAAGTPFSIEPKGLAPDVAFDGRDFVVASWSQDPPASRLTIARVGPGGTVTKARSFAEHDEQPSYPVVAASPSLPPLLAYVDRRSAYDGLRRGALLFASEINAYAAPEPPSLVSATRNDDDTVTVEWEPMPGILGISIDLQLPDRTLRTIGVANAIATSARVPLAGLTGPAVRVRAWNANGLSSPSRPAVIVDGKRRAAR